MKKQYPLKPRPDRSKPHYEPNFGRDDSLGEVDVNARGPRTITTKYGDDSKGRPLYRTEEAAEQRQMSATSTTATETTFHPKKPLATVEVNARPKRRMRDDLKK